MKRRILIFVALIMLCVVGPIGAQECQLLTNINSPVTVEKGEEISICPELIVYSHKFYKFKIGLPATWNQISFQEKNPQDYGKITSISFSKKDSPISLHILLRNDKFTSLQQRGKQQLASLREDYNVPGVSYKEIEVKGLDALKLDSSDTGLISYLISNETMIYELTAGSFVSAYHLDLKEVEEIISSISIGDDSDSSNDLDYSQDTITAQETWVVNDNSLDPWEFTFDGRNWQVGYEEDIDNTTIVEYVLEGESLQKWNELVSSNAIEFPANATIDDAFERFISTRSKDCSSFTWKILEREDSSILMEWRHKGCQGWLSQHEIRKMEKFGDFLYNLSYVQKTRTIDSQQRDSWVEIIKNSSLRAKAKFQYQD